MRDHISLTAIAVATGRALAGVDPYAHMFLPQWISERIRDAAPHRRQRLIEWLSLGFVTHMKHRTIAIDEALKEAIARGISQVVILGAGLDTRAYRIAELESATVYEVDHPSTQAAKLKNVHLIRSQARMLKHVQVDFERDSLERSLEDAGHKSNEPTAFIWEGVTMYLEKPAVDATLTAIERRSAPSSRLTMTYVKRRPLQAPLFTAARLAFASLGEPLRAMYNPHEVKALLERHRFEVRWDGFSDEWRGNTQSALPFRLVEERIVVADRSEK